MCGIAAWLSSTAVSREKIREVGRIILQRGPDGNGYIVESFNDQIQVGLLHNRLSIIDLSEEAAQPMQSKCGDYTISFNGEIYNYRELRSELEARGACFVTKSDTEVLLQAYQHWGTAVFRKLVGMFAVTILDKKKSVLILARDPYGIKPLYWFSDSRGIWVASEIPALLALADIKPKVNLQVAHDYLTFGHVDQTTQSFFEGVYSLPSAHFVEIAVKKPPVLFETECYFNQELSEVNDECVPALANKIRDQFLENIDLHMRSDVPVGACLSGGIDSSSIVCAMRELNPTTEIHTFSYIAESRSLSEEKWVDVINKKIGGRSHKIHISRNDLETDLENLIKAQGEPFGSTSIYAQYKLFEAAANSGIKVILDGQGADELFAGYPSHRGALLAASIRRGGLLSACKLLQLGSGHHETGRWMLLKLALHFLMPKELYSTARAIAGQGNKLSWIDLEKLSDRGVNTTIVKPQHYSTDILRRALKYSLEISSVPQLLRYEDRNSMAHSVESRVPFLTPKMSSLAYSLPNDQLINTTQGSKAIFKVAMKGIVPDMVLNRKDKIGFQTPEQDFLIPDSGWVSRTLGQASDYPWLKSEKMQSEWSAVLEGKRKYTRKIWRWINFIKWASAFNVE